MSAAELLRRLAAAPAPGSWYAVTEHELRFSTKAGDRPFILSRPLLGPIATGFVRSRLLSRAVPGQRLPGSAAAWCDTPDGPGILHPPHVLGHDRRCGLSARGLIPMWYVASVAATALDETTRRCREPDQALVEALRCRLAPGRE